MKGAGKKRGKKFFKKRTLHKATPEDEPRLPSFGFCFLMSNKKKGEKKR